MKKSDQYLKEEKIFKSVKKAAEGFTQKEVAEHLDVSEASVSKMMNGQSKMLSLAVRWLEMRMPILDWSIETDDEGKPIKYYKAISSNE